MRVCVSVYVCLCITVCLCVRVSVCVCAHTCVHVCQYPGCQFNAQVLLLFRNFTHIALVHPAVLMGT